MNRSKPIEILRGKPRFTSRDTRCGIYRLDRKTGREAYIWLGDRRRRKHR